MKFTDVVVIGGGPAGMSAALAAASMSAVLASGRPKPIFSRAVAAKMVVSCGTMARRARTAAGSASRRSTPSTRMLPDTGS